MKGLKVDTQCMKCLNTCQIQDIGKLRFEFDNDQVSGQILASHSEFGKRVLLFDSEIKYPECGAPAWRYGRRKGLIPTA